MSQIKVILIPGNGGATISDSWFPYLAREIPKLGIPVVAQNFPDPILARKHHWLPFLQKTLKADAGSILIGHSSGAIAAMKHSEQNPIYGSILVGAYHTHLDDHHEKLSGYFNEPWDWDAVRNNQNWIVQFSSIDDPYIPIEEARTVNRYTSSEYYEYDNHGHFGDDIDKEEFPEIITILKNKLNI